MKHQNYGQALRQAREKRGITQEEMAANLFLSQAAYSRMETGRNIPNMVLFEKAAGLLEMDPSMLMKQVEGSEQFLSRTRLLGWDKRHSSLQVPNDMLELNPGEAATIHGAGISSKIIASFPKSWFWRIVLWSYLATAAYDFVRGFIDGAGI